MDKVCFWFRHKELFLQQDRVGLSNLQKEWETMGYQVETEEKNELWSKENLLLTDDEELLKHGLAVGMTCIACVSEEPELQAWYQGADLVLEGMEEISASFLMQVWCHRAGIPWRVAQGTRIYLQELSEADFESLFRLYQLPEVRKWTDEMEGAVQEEREKFIAYIRQVYSFYGYGLWGIYELKSDHLVGVCGLEQKEWMNHCDLIQEEFALELEYALNPMLWGQGIATEAAMLALQSVKSFGCETVYARIAPDNHASVRVAKRIGMKLFATQEMEGKQVLLYRRKGGISCSEIPNKSSKF